MSESGELPAGAIIGDKYKIIEKISYGSVGDEVYKGFHLEFERDILIRMLPPNITGDAEMFKRFIREIKLTAALNHPNILMAYEAGQEGVFYFLVTAYEKGFFLNDYLEQRGCLEEVEAIKMIIALAQALEYAWEKEKIIHRNINPKTILIARGNQPMITDFGMAKTMTDGATKLTMGGFTIGNPQYMSPEQVKADIELDYRVDMYCLGLVLYEMLTGHPAFRYKSAIELMTAQLEEEPVSVDVENDSVSKNCVYIIDKMLKKDRRCRYENWGELLADLQAILDRKESLPSKPATKVKPAGQNKVKSVPPRAAKKPVSGDNADDLKDLLKEAETAKKKQLKKMVIILVVIVNIIIISGAVIYIASRKAPVARKVKPKAMTSSLVKTSPVASSVSTEQQQETEGMKKRDEMWQFAIEFAGNATKKKEDYDLAIQNFENIKKSLAGSKYELMADLEISKLNKLKQQEIEAVISGLKEKTQALTGKNEYVAAAEIYKNYSGRFSEETVSRRTELAEALIQRNAELNAAKSIQVVNKQRRQRQFLDELAKLLVNGKYKQALLEFSESPYKGSMPKVEKVLTELNNIDKTIIKEINVQTGKVVTIGKYTGKIQKIKGKTLFLREAVGKGFVVRKINIRKMTLADSLKFLDKMDKTAKTVYIGLRVAKSRGNKAAVKYFDKAGILSGPLKDQIKK